MFDFFIPIILLVLLIKILRRNKKVQLQKTDAIFITGCDSGIGYSLACYCQELGMTVFAGCLHLGEGAYQLEELERIHVIPIDVTNTMSVKTAASRIQSLLADNSGVCE